MQTNTAAFNLRYVAFVEIIAIYITNLQKSTVGSHKTHMT